LRLEARNNGGFPFGKFFFLFTQGSFSGMKSVLKIFNTRIIFFAFLRAFLLILSFLSNSLARFSARCNASG
jgi:hypothetical protein